MAAKQISFKVSEQEFEMIQTALKKEQDTFNSELTLSSFSKALHNRAFKRKFKNIIDDYKSNLNNVDYLEEDDGEISLGINNSDIC